MIDTRYPPQPKELKITLYPLQNNIDLSVILKSVFLPVKSIRNQFFNELKNYCDGPMSENNFIFLDSASSCLYEYLRWKIQTSEKQVKVAVPVYCCPDVGCAIVNAGAIPVFIDLEPDFSISKKSVDFAYSCGSSIFIWPSFYGKRERNPYILNYIEQRNMDIILDDAQSFPASRVSIKYKTLISFGVTKRMGGIGGGAMSFPDENEKKLVQNYVSDNISTSKSLSSFLKKSAFIKLKNWLGHKRKLELELPVYVDRSTKNALNSKLRVYNMASYEYLTAVKRFRQLEQEKINLKKLYERIFIFMEKTFGHDALSNNADFEDLPTIFTLRFPSDQRFANSSRLAELGIQTSWYYYPINKISSFSQYESELSPNTEQLSSEVLMVPFGIGHALKQMNKYEAVLRGS